MQCLYLTVKPKQSVQSCTWSDITGVWDSCHGVQGEFSLEGRFPEVRSNVKLVQGLFNESLPKFIKSYYKVRNPVDITYLHIDCDLYQGQLLSHHMPNAKRHRMCLHQHNHQIISQSDVPMPMMTAMFDCMHRQYLHCTHLMPVGVSQALSSLQTILWCGRRYRSIDTPGQVHSPWLHSAVWWPHQLPGLSRTWNFSSLGVARRNWP